MTPNAIRWDAPALSTASVQAAIHYRDGVTALVSGVAHADRLLAAAVALDPGFVLADIALAVARAITGRAYAATPLPPRLSRGERQHAETVDAMLGGDGDHGADLRREHLQEYPGDVLIVWLPLVARSAM
jgi:hypothetical protein